MQLLVLVRPSVRRRYRPRTFGYPCALHGRPAQLSRYRDKKERRRREKVTMRATTEEKREKRGR